MEKYICKIANIEEMETNWNYLIETHTNNKAWKTYKENAIINAKENKTIVYYGILNDRIISEATAMLSSEIVQNGDGLVDDTTVYLSAFRTIKEFQGKGYFSKLYRFMENDLKQRGYTALTLGVEPSEVRNKMIYSKFGFTEHIKTAYETEPPEENGKEPHIIEVDYYRKKL